MPHLFNDLEQVIKSKLFIPIFLDTVLSRLHVSVAKQGPFTPRVLSNDVKHDCGTEVFGKAEFN